MGKLLCEKNLRDVWCRNESVRAEIFQILHTHTHTHAHTHTHTHTRAAKLVVKIGPNCIQCFHGGDVNNTMNNAVTD